MWPAVVIVLGLGASVIAWQVLGEDADIPPIGVSEGATLAVAAIGQLVALGSLGLLFRVGLRAHDADVGLVTSLRAGLVAAAVVRLVPAGGAISAPAMALTVDNEIEGSTGEAIRATVISYGGLVTWAGLGVVAVGGVGSSGRAATAAITVGTVATIVGILVVVGSTWVGSAIGKLPAWIRGRLGRTIDNRLPSWEEMGWLAFRLVLETAVLWLSLRAFGIELGIAELVLAYGVSQVVGGATGLPGGVGVTEASLVGILSALGVGAAAAVGPVFVYRIISQWLPAGLGLLAGGAATIVNLRSS